MSNSNKGKNAVSQLSWYKEENGFDRSQYYAGGECIDLRGLRLEKTSLAGADLTAVRLDFSEFIDVDLKNAKLTSAKMRNCYFIRVDLRGADLYAVDFGEGQFLMAKLSNANCIGAEFHRSNFALAEALATDFRSANFTKSTIQTLRWDKKTDFRGADLAGASFTHDPLLKRYIEDQNWLSAKEEQLSQTKIGSVLWFLWGVTSCYGQSFLRWLLVSFILAMLYGIVYQFLDLQIELTNVNPVLAKFYFSVVTFTTLGFGDIIPASNIAVIVVMSEVTCGYLMLGALISILADKFARRS